MKKLLLSLLIAVLPLGTLAAFQPATLYKGADRVKVVVQEQAQKLFSQGYKLETKLLGYTPTTGYSERLTQSITNVATTIYVSSVVDRDNIALPLSAINKGYFTIEAGTAREEAIVCTGVSTLTPSLTGCTRGLLATGSSEAGTGLKYSHNAGSRIIMTNIAQFYSNYVDTTTNQTIAGIKTFTSSPIAPIPTTNTQVAIKSYVDGVAIAGGANASQTVKGITKLSSDPSVGTNPIALNSEEVATTTGANKVVRANSSGYLNPSWLGSSVSYILGSTTTVSGTLNVSATTTFTGLTRVSTSTPTVAGQVVGLDGSAKLPAVDGSKLTGIGIFNSGTTTKDAASTATTTIAHSLGAIPRYVRIEAMYNAGSTATSVLFAKTVYNGTTQSSISFYMPTTNSNILDNTFSLGVTGNFGQYLRGVVTFNETNIVINWTANQSPTGNYTILWEAYR
jgi:hypothetical protein